MFKYFARKKIDKLHEKVTAINTKELILLKISQMAGTCTKQEIRKIKRYQRWANRHDYLMQKYFPEEWKEMLEKRKQIEEEEKRKAEEDERKRKEEEALNGKVTISPLLDAADKYVSCDLFKELDKKVTELSQRVDKLENKGKKGKHKS